MKARTVASWSTTVPMVAYYRAKSTRRFNVTFTIRTDPRNSNPIIMPTFLERLQDPAPIFYDGAFGTELFIRDIKLPNSTLANELYPEAVRDVHDAYIAAGSDIIGTNTFVSSPLHLEMADHNADDADKLVTNAVKIAGQQPTPATGISTSPARSDRHQGPSRPMPAAPTSVSRIRKCAMHTNGSGKEWPRPVLICSVWKQCFPLLKQSSQWILSAGSTCRSLSTAHISIPKTGPPAKSSTRQTGATP
ncbi:MAG TPA: hypothetical protein DIT01_09685 [Lentisphaeria bacterium]|nr:hypothetical protein [Lentisphaeria bacterium]